MRGILYGVGVGPGDPELMTLKAVRMIRENEVIAVPGQRQRKLLRTRSLYRRCRNWRQRIAFLSICQ